MPKTKEQVDTLRLERKKEIALVGLKIFCKKGYDSTTIDDIVKGAKCSHGLFYHYFKNRQELFEHVIQLHKQNTNQTIVQKISDVQDYSKKLTIILNSIFSDLKNDENFSYHFYFFISQSFALKEKGVRRVRKQMDEKPPFIIMENFFKVGQERGEFRNDFSPTQCASMFFSIIQGATIGYVIAPKDLQKKMTLPSVDFIVDVFTKTRS